MNRKKINRDDLPAMLEALAKRIREQGQKWPGGRALASWAFVEVKAGPDDQIPTSLLELSFHLDAETEIDLCQDAIFIVDPEASKRSPEDFINKEILYTNGHKCVPNGVGDYKFICPTMGEKPGFIPFFYRGMLAGKCKCGQEIALEAGTSVHEQRP